MSFLAVQNVPIQLPQLRSHVFVAENVGEAAAAFPAEVGAPLPCPAAYFRNRSAWEPVRSKMIWSPSIL